jgi:hypothetical protein
MGRALQDCNILQANGAAMAFGRVTRQAETSLRGSRSCCAWNWTTSRRLAAGSR